MWDDIFKGLFLGHSSLTLASNYLVTIFNCMNKYTNTFKFLCVTALAAVQEMKLEIRRKRMRWKGGGERHYEKEMMKIYMFKCLMVEYSWKELLVIFKFKVTYNVTGQHGGFNKLALAPVCVSVTINSKFTRTRDFVRACNYTRIHVWIQYSFFLFNNLKNNYCTSKLIILAVFVLLIK